MEQEQQQTPTDGNTEAVPMGSNSAGSAPSVPQASEFPGHGAAGQPAVAQPFAAAGSQAPAPRQGASNACATAPQQPAAYAQQPSAPQQTASYASQRYAELYAQPAAPARNDSLFANVFGWLAASIVPALVVVASEFGSVLVLGIVFAIFGLVLPLNLIDSDMTESLLMVAMQLSAIVFLLPWWDYIYQRSFLRRRRAEVPRRSRAVKVVQRVIGVVLIGLALQVVFSALVSFVLDFFPTVSQEYSDLMEEPTGGAALAISMLSATVGAPLMEELAVRALVFEFALRAFNFDRREQWRLPRTSSSFSSGKEARERDLNAYAKGTRGTDTIPPVAFWLANIVQAFIFALLHMNITQGVYTFFMGLIFGWVAWRTGKLRYSILLHFTLNASSYVLDALPIYDNLAYVLFTLIMVLVAIAGLALFESGCTEDGETDAPALASDLAAKYAAPAPTAPVASANAVAAASTMAASAAAATVVPGVSAELAAPMSSVAAAPAPAADAPAVSGVLTTSAIASSVSSESAPTAGTAPSCTAPASTIAEPRPHDNASAL